jgi:hypothetical protein
MRKILLMSVAASLLLALAGRATAQDATRAVIEKAVQATGGATKLARLKVTQSKFKGTMEIQGATANITGETFLQLPGKMKLELQATIQGQTFTLNYVVNGSKAWVRVADQTINFQDADLEDAREELYAESVQTLVPLLRDKAFSLESLGVAKVKGRDSVGVKVASRGHKEVNLYFDKRTGLLAKAERRTLDDNKQEVTEETFYSEYRQVEGVQVPMKLLVHHDGKEFLNVTVTEYTFPERIDDGEFARPGG